MLDRAVDSKPDVFTPEHAKELIERGFVTLPSHIPRFIPDATRGLRELIVDKNRNLFSIDDPADRDPDGFPDAGFISRDGRQKENLNADELAQERSAYDTKCFIHWRTTTRGVLARTHQGRDYNAFARWMSVLDRALMENYELALQIAEQLDRLYPQFRMKQRVRNGYTQNTLRTLYYPAEQPEDMIGKPHFDRCLLTLHVGSEGHEGLWAKDCQGNLIKVPEANPRVITVFFGIKAFRASQGIYRPLFHGVFDPTSIERKKNGRSSIVNFVSGDLPETRTREEAWLETWRPKKPDVPQCDIEALFAHSAQRAA